MTPAEVHDIIGVEYDLVAIDADIANVMVRIKGLSGHGALDATIALHRAQLTIRQALAHLADPIAEAVALHQNDIEPPPF